MIHVISAMKVGFVGANAVVAGDLADAWERGEKYFVKNADECAAHARALEWAVKGWFFDKDRHWTLGTRL